MIKRPTSNQGEIHSFREARREDIGYGYWAQHGLVRSHIRERVDIGVNRMRIDLARSAYFTDQYEMDEKELFSCLAD